MVVVGLFVKAQLENVKELRVPEGHLWTFDVKESTGYETREFVTISDENLADTGNSRNLVHSCIVFKDSKKRGTITVKTVKDVTQNAITKSNEYTCIGAFDCRGMDITKWYVRGGYEVVSDGDKVIPNVEFDETGAWVGFDEENSLPLSVMEVQYEFRTI
ncbi:hypothetical protein BgAZ_501450 [Babesia gibsoni]|uniref:DUF866 domain-containing protein n=1 Tax=Babesia gibsoni TaxID=33632 RepID=A0AAD8PC96_BABGI|nr:hypothetical protein BgAZ_501450 [Babesia gibsoni]